MIMINFGDVLDFGKTLTFDLPSRVKSFDKSLCDVTFEYCCLYNLCYITWYWLTSTVFVVVFLSSTSCVKGRGDSAPAT